MASRVLSLDAKSGTGRRRRAWEPVFSSAGIGGEFRPDSRSPGLQSRCDPATLLSSVRIKQSGFIPGFQFQIVFRTFGGILFLNQTTSAGDATHASDRRGLTRNSPHSVHFYEDDSLFLDSLGEFIGAALGAGSACVVIATNTHHNGLAHRLTALGLDLGLAADTNRYIALDAAELLTRFMVDGWPDETRFVQTIEPRLRQARSGSRKLTTPVVAFGEMVSVLCMQGLTEAALRLEQLWNELAKRHALSLRCAYPMELFSGTGGSDVFHRICAEHNAVIPAESYLKPEGASFPAGTELHLHSTPLHFALELRQKEIEQRRKVEDRLRATEE